MTDCLRLRELLGELIDGELDAARAAWMQEHLRECPECAALAETMIAIRDDAAAVASLLEPPDELAGELAASPCRRWLGLLYRAVDRELSEAGLTRLVGHLEGCASCRRAWNDLTLIHQAGEALAPPPGLLERCVAAPRRGLSRSVIGRRTATAAAYLLAVLTSLTVGNPVTLARVQAQRVADTVSEEVSQVAAESRGEARVVLWRTWQFVDRQLGVIREAVGIGPSNDDGADAPEEERAADDPRGEPK